MFCAETTSDSARALLRAALVATREERGWQALKLARRVVSHESAVLEREGCEP